MSGYDLAVREWHDETDKCLQTRREGGNSDGEETWECGWGVKGAIVVEVGRMVWCFVYAMGMI